MSASAAAAPEVVANETQEQLTTSTPETPVVITDEQVAQRAYEIYQREGEEHGNHDRHWFQAIEELTNEIGQTVVRYFKS